jgi:putative zinc finger/helix-turn-helix YgiT family protein
MINTCPNCNKKSLEYINKKENLNIRREDIEVIVKYYRCKSCQKEFDDLDLENDYYDEAYRKYRKKHNLMQPDEIKSIRKKYKLTQYEMNKILGFGEATLSRYENGALQDEVHDNLLKFISNSKNFLYLLNNVKNKFNRKDFLRIKKNVIALKNREYNFYDEILDNISDYKEDILSGFKKFNKGKMFNAILFFSKRDIFKTKLNKLLFYMDFKYFKEFNTSITGLRYVKLDYGPVPDKFDFFYDIMLANKFLCKKEKYYSNEIIGEIYYALEKPDLNIFSTDELENILKVEKIFKNFSATKIKDFSHEEEAWKKTRDNKIISYEYAASLNI